MYVVPGWEKYLASRPGMYRASAGDVFCYWKGHDPLFGLLAILGFFWDKREREAGKKALNFTVGTVAATERISSMSCSSRIQLAHDPTNLE